MRAFPGTRWIAGKQHNSLSKQRLSSVTGGSKGRAGRNHVLPPSPRFSRLQPGRKSLHNAAMHPCAPCYMCSFFTCAFSFFLGTVCVILKQECNAHPKNEPRVNPPSNPGKENRGRGRRSELRVLGEATGEQRPAFSAFSQARTRLSPPASPFCAKQPLKPLPSWLSLGCSFRTDDAPHRMQCFPLPLLCPCPLKSFRPPRIPLDGREQERGKAGAPPEQGNSGIPRDSGVCVSIFSATSMFSNNRQREEGRSQPQNKQATPAPW